MKWQNMCAALYGSSFPSGCCGAANIFQPGFSWEEDEFRGWRKWKVWLFLIGHSEATGKLNKRDKLKNPLWPPFPAMVIELDGMNNILMILLICGQEAIRVQWDYLLWSLNVWLYCWSLQKARGIKMVWKQFCSVGTWMCIANTTHQFSCF